MLSREVQASLKKWTPKHYDPKEAQRRSSRSSQRTSDIGQLYKNQSIQLDSPLAFHVSPRHALNSSPRCARSMRSLDSAGKCEFTRVKFWLRSMPSKTTSQYLAYESFASEESQASSASGRCWWGICPVPNQRVLPCATHSTTMPVPNKCLCLTSSASCWRIRTATA